MADGQVSNDYDADFKRAYIRVHTGRDVPVLEPCMECDMPTKFRWNGSPCCPSCEDALTRDFGWAR